MICNHCKQALPAGYVIKYGRPLIKNHARIIELRKNGLKLKDVANEVNCSVRTVTRVIATQCR